MSDSILICNSCGKEYKAAPGAESQVAGKPVCPACWSESELERELTKAADNLTKTGKIAMSIPASHATKDHKCSELEAQIDELKARLSLAEERQANAVKEREFALESRQKLEKTLAEFLTRFAAKSEAEVAAVKERDRLRRELEEVIASLRQQLANAAEETAKSMKNCEKATQARAELEKRINEFMDLLAAERQAHADAMRSQADALKDRDAKSDTSRVLESQLAELYSKVEAARQAEALAVEKCDAAIEANLGVETKVAQLRAQAAAAIEEAATARRERDAGKARQVELELDLAEMKEKCESAQAAVSERDVAQAELKDLREAAIASLEPLAVECNRDMKELMGETESVLNETRRAREEAAMRLEKIERLTANLRAHINAVRRQMSQKVSLVLGTPAARSGVHPSVTPAPPASAPDDAAVPKPPSSAVLAGVSPAVSGKA